MIASACWRWCIALDLGPLSVAGIAAVGLLLVYEHSLVKAERSVARRRGLLHHERLRQRAILCVLGRRYVPGAARMSSNASFH